MSYIPTSNAKKLTNNLLINKNIFKHFLLKLDNFTLEESEKLCKGGELSDDASIVVLGRTENVFEEIWFVTDSIPLDLQEFKLFILYIFIFY